MFHTRSGEAFDTSRRRRQWPRQRAHIVDRSELVPLGRRVRIWKSGDPAVCSGCDEIAAVCTDRFRRAESCRRRFERPLGCGDGDITISCDSDSRAPVILVSLVPEHGHVASSFPRDEAEFTDCIPRDGHSENPSTGCHVQICGSGGGVVHPLFGERRVSARHTVSVTVSGQKGLDSPGRSVPVDLG
jgi:hypothetical protein